MNHMHTNRAGEALISPSLDSYTEPFRHEVYTHTHTHTLSASYSHDESMQHAYACSGFCPKHFRVFAIAIAINKIVDIDSKKEKKNS